MTWVEIATIVSGSVGALGGAGAFLSVLFGRRKQRAEADRTEAEAERSEAEATQIITGTAVSMMKKLEENAERARVEAEQAREEMRAVRSEAHQLARELHSLRMAVMRPDATIESLRLLVSGSWSNGRGN